MLSAVIWIKFSGVIKQGTFSSVLPDASFGNVAQSGADQAVPEVRLEQDIYDPGDTRSIHFGQYEVDFCSFRVSERPPHRNVWRGGVRYQTPPPGTTPPPSHKPRSLLPNVGRLG